MGQVECSTPGSDASRRAGSNPTPSMPQFPRPKLGGPPFNGRYAPAPMDAAALRAEFPVLERLAYLNAGTDGPIPAAAVAAAARRSPPSSPTAASTRTSSAAARC